MKESYAFFNEWEKNYTEFEFCIGKLHEIYISVQHKSITTRIIYVLFITSYIEF